jgi:PAS domain S-box-containing protein
MVFTTGEPAYAVDDSGRIMAWNRAAERTFGYSQEAAVGANCWELLEGRDVFGNQYCGERCPHRQMALHNKTINRCRMRFRLASGEYAEFLLSTMTLQESDGHHVLIHLCKPEVGVARTDPRNPRARGTLHLTERETQVLVHLAEGQSTSKIAAALSISIPTVRNHIEHILAKLECHSRLEAVAVARKQRLI